MRLRSNIENEKQPNATTVIDVRNTHDLLWEDIQCIPLSLKCIKLFHGMDNIYIVKQMEWVCRM